MRKADYAIRKFNQSNYDWEKFDKVKKMAGVRSDIQLLRRAVGFLEEHLIKERFR